MSAHDPIKLLKDRSLPVARKGYDRAATDELLYELEVSLTSILGEYARAQSRLAELEQKISDFRSREQEILHALLLASRVRTESEHEAQEVVKAAAVDAERLLEAARSKVRGFDEETHEAEALAANARARLTEFLQELLVSIEHRRPDLDSAVDELLVRAGAAETQGASEVEPAPVTRLA
jgi:cell division septum initiation protein DivIVA